MHLNATSTDVYGSMSMIFKVLGPIYAIVFGLMAVRLLFDKAVKKIFPNYNPKGKRRGSRTRRGGNRTTNSSRNNSKAKSSSTAKSSTKSKSKPKYEIPAYMVGAKKPIKRSERTTIFMSIKHNAEVNKVKDKVLGDRYYISYDNYSDRTASGRPRRTNILLDESRNVRIKQIGKTYEISYD
jgi:hypothetical protein